MADGTKLRYAESGELALPPEVGLVPAAVDRLRDWLTARGAPEDTVAALRLAVSEALANAVKYGRFTASDREIRMHWAWAGPWLELQISEPGSFVPPAGWTSLPEDPLAESGRGGFLIAGAVDEMAHENHGGRHTLRLRKQLGGPPPAPAAAAELEQTLTAMTGDLSASYEALAALFKLAETLATTENLAAFIGHVLQLRSLLEADTMHVRIRDSADQLVLLGAETPGCDFPRLIPSDGNSTEAAVFRSGLERTTEGRGHVAAEDPLHGLEGPAVVCPVHFQSRPLGVCVFGRRSPGAHFTAAQVSLARSTAEFVGIACANAELQTQRLAQLSVGRELEIAARIQQSLLPTVFPQRPDWRVHGRCANALEAGGDFFDVLEAGGGLLLVIADVMGKGVPAALLAVVLRTAVRAHTELAATPGRLLTQVNRQIAPDLDRLGMFITAQAVFLAPDAARLTYASAGHGPVIVLAAGGAIRRLEEGGLPLGLAQDETYADHTVPLAPGERALLSTDGLTEAPDEQGRELGLDGLARAALGVQALGLEQAGAELLAVLKRRDAGRAPTDDRTLLFVQRLS